MREIGVSETVPKSRSLRSDIMISMISDIRPRGSVFRNCFRERKCQQPLVNEIQVYGILDQNDKEKVKQLAKNTCLEKNNKKGKVLAGSLTNTTGYSNHISYAVICSLNGTFDQSFTYRIIYMMEAFFSPDERDKASVANLVKDECLDNEGEIVVDSLTETTSYSGRVSYALICKYRNT